MFLLEEMFLTLRRCCWNSLAVELFCDAIAYNLLKWGFSKDTPVLIQGVYISDWQHGKWLSVSVNNCSLCCFEFWNCRLLFLKQLCWKNNTATILLLFVKPAHSSHVHHLSKTTSMKREALSFVVSNIKTSFRQRFMCVLNQGRRIMFSPFSE